MANGFRRETKRFALSTSLIAALIGLGFFSFSRAHAASKMTIQSDNTVVYSGPNIKYRPLEVLGKDTVLPASPKIVSGEGGEFYKVLIRQKSGSRTRRSIGYIPVTAAVLIEHADFDEGIEKYKSLKLARSAFQASVSYLRQQTYVWQAGYLKYPAPGFYIKGFTGQIFDNTSDSFLFGVESGNDSFIQGPYSAYASVGLGLALPSDDSSPFLGAKSATSFFLSGSAGARYNAAEHASVSLGLGSVSIFNKNNSFVSMAVMMTFEVGL
jgi:hypothetical protein